MVIFMTEWVEPMNGRQPVTFPPIMAGMGSAHERAPARDLSADYGGYGQRP